MKKKLYNELQDCYSAQAEHFGHTRKKFWPELEYIEEAISYKLQATSWKSSAKSKFSLLELGCGVGREKLFDMFDKALSGRKWEYIGIDNASWMIEQAKKQTYASSPNINFSCVDMLEYLRSLEDESVDIVLGIASVQHLMDVETRRILRQHVYRVLKREGKMILINRSYSDWFLRKYRKFQLKTLARVLWSLGSRARNDIIIPRKDPWFQQNKKYRERYYHIFSLYELKQLSRLAWFVIKKLWYIQQDWSWSQDDWRGARNSLLVVEKGVLKRWKDEVVSKFRE